MGMPAARVGDVGVGICCCHSEPPCLGMVGFIIMGSATDYVNGMQAARVSDMVISGCGHIGIINRGSGTVLKNGLPAARLGDGFSGCFNGTLVSGSSNNLIGG